jgi:hypothetical protein
MLKVIINGGLGNQLFQLFSAIKLANTYKLEKISVSQSFFFRNNALRNFDILSCINEVEIKKNYGISLEYTNNKIDIPIFFISTRLPYYLCRVFNIYNDRTENYPLLPERTLIAGYHQSIFRLPPRKTIYKNFLNNPCKVHDGYSVHFRRGDYLLSRNCNYGVVSFDSILRVLRENSAFNNHVFFFSDSFIKNQILLKLTTYEACHVTFSSDMNLNSISEFNFMRGSKNLICSNSTFSWWAAFSSNNLEQVFLPNKWNKLSTIPEDLIIENSVLYPVDFD